ncbi:hypothetical protein ABW19_dt0205008 [Dactylella cylindrospora]|nr:hypothetical protein ABW19_dt0205008 [Dactylella cylindrospora]
MALVHAALQPVTTPLADYAAAYPDQLAKLSHDVGNFVQVFQQVYPTGAYPTTDPADSALLKNLDQLILMVRDFDRGLRQGVAEGYSISNSDLKTALTALKEFVTDIQSIKDQQIIGVQDDFYSTRNPQVNQGLPEPASLWRTAQSVADFLAENEIDQVSPEDLTKWLFNFQTVPDPNNPGATVDLFDPQGKSIVATGFGTMLHEFQMPGSVLETAKNTLVRKMPRFLQQELAELPLQQYVRDIGSGIDLYVKYTDAVRETIAELPSWANFLNGDDRPSYDDYGGDDGGDGGGGESGGNSNLLGENLDEARWEDDISKDFENLDQLSSGKLGGFGGGFSNSKPDAFRKLSFDLSEKVSNAPNSEGYVLKKIANQLDANNNNNNLGGNGMMPQGNTNLQGNNNIPQRNSDSPQLKINKQLLFTTPNKYDALSSEDELDYQAGELGSIAAELNSAIEQADARAEADTDANAAIEAIAEEDNEGSSEEGGQVVEQVADNSGEYAADISGSDEVDEPEQAEEVEVESEGDGGDEDNAYAYDDDEDFIYRMDLLDEDDDDEPVVRASDDELF